MNLANGRIEQRNHMAHPFTRGARAWAQKTIELYRGGRGIHGWTPADTLEQCRQSMDCRNSKALMHGWALLHVHRAWLAAGRLPHDVGMSVVSIGTGGLRHSGCHG